MRTNIRWIPVWKYTLDGELIKVYASTKECREENNIFASNLSAALRSYNKSVKWFRYKWLPVIDK